MEQLPKIYRSGSLYDGGDARARLSGSIGYFRPIAHAVETPRPRRYFAYFFSRLDFFSFCLSFDSELFTMLSLSLLDSDIERGNGLLLTHDTRHVMCTRGSVHFYDLKLWGSLSFGFFFAFACQELLISF